MDSTDNIITWTHALSFTSTNKTKSSPPCEAAREAHWYTELHPNASLSTQRQHSEALIIDTTLFFIYFYSPT